MVVTRQGDTKNLVTNGGFEDAVCGEIVFSDENGKINSFNSGDEITASVQYNNFKEGVTSSPVFLLAEYPDCWSVKQMSEKNKDYMTCTRDDAIARGYVSCKNCNP